MTLDFDPTKAGSAPRDAATVLLVRDGGASGLEVFCVQRSQASSFMGGAVVFPGGKVDDADADPAWVERALFPESLPEGFARPLVVAACRETLEEAALLSAAPPVGDAEARDAQSQSASGFAALFGGGRRLDARGFVPFARWITPVAESRRFDARFFLAVAPAGQTGAHDTRETVRSFWARPADVLAEFERGEVTLFPPTHRTLEILASCSNAAAAIAYAEGACLDPICPRLVPQGDTMALVLPGDPEHDVGAPRCPGRSRFVLRAGKWLPEGAPPAGPR
ncbi:MAG: hypothetical protein JNL38_23090 [Myxococcales bacterium]|jgi:8-oxo-dGTP pyrophosphatase MutT (NUDIX family)|nr:hypothetical protein [Myxococcales bacterium]